MVKWTPQNWFPPGTNFLINKDPLELILLQNMDSCVHCVIIFVNAVKGNLGILMKTSQPYATVGTTDVISSNFMTVDMHRFALMWLVYSRNKFFRVGQEKFVPGGTNFRGVQITHDR